MDIALKFKRVVATVATVALFASTASVAIAQTFNDVPTDAWYATYVEQLVGDGVVDAGDYYRPADALNRAELTKMAITAIDGLAGYEAPATPTFDDVAADAWYYDYIEAAVQLGIVNGYTDAQSNLTGMFGPGDTVNRAAATKILVNAFSVPTDLDPTSSFPDVQSGAWYYDYVVTAYNQSVLDGYDTGYFGPADPVTRAQVAKLVVLSQSPVERVAEEEEEEEEEETTSEGDLEVSLNDDTPASTTIPQYASSVNLLSFDVTAADDDVVISQIIVTRGGVGQVTDWDALYLYDSSTRLTSGRTINSDTNTATFPITLTVEAGTTTTLTLVGDLINTTTAGASNQHYFYVASAADVTSNAVAVSGDFPTVGNIFTIGSTTTTVETITVTVGSTPSQPQIGALDAEIGTFKLQAGATNDVALHQITVTQNGSLSSDKMVNLRLLRGTDEVATSDGFVSDRVTFVLDTPYVIQKGQTKTFYVRSDIDGGRTSDSIELYLDENTDLVAIDQQYGFGAVISNSTFTIAGVTAIDLKGGKVTLTDNGPSAEQIATNSTNQKLLDYALTTDRDLTVRNTDLTITVTDGTDTPDWAASTSTLDKVPLLGTYSLANFTISGTNHADDGITITINGTAGTAVTAGATATDTSLATAVAADIVANIAGYSATSVAAVVYIVSTAAGGAGAISYAYANTDAGDPAATAATMTVSACAATEYELDTVANYTLAANADMLQSGTSYMRVVSGGATSITGGMCVYSDDDLTALATNAVLTEVNVYSYIKNIKIVDLDTDGTVAGPLTYASGGTEYNTCAATKVAGSGADTCYLKTFTEDYDLTGGETRHLSIQFDSDINLVASYQITATINYAVASYIKDMDANEYVAIADVVGSPLTGKNMTVASNSLVVAKASTPTTQTYVKGENAVPSLGINLKAGDAGIITIKKLTVRAYGDNDATFSGVGTGEGDIAANTYVSTITLYDGDDIIAGPESIDLVDTGSSGAYVAETDYYKAVFEDLNYEIEAGATKTLVAKVSLLNTMAIVTYVALDLVPASDIVCEDSDDNTVTPSGAALNLAATPSPLITINTAGTLAAYSEGNPESGIVVAGTDELLVAKYRFHALQEGFEVSKLTVQNDDTTTFETPLATNAVNNIIIKYPDANGVTQTATAALAGGQATLSGLDFYVPKDDDAYVEIYAEVNDKTVIGEAVSGQAFRLGIQEGATNTVSTLKAVGESSSTTVTGNTLTVASSVTVNGYIVRTSVPTFAKVVGSTTLINGENVLYGVTVTADSAGSVGLARLVFDVTTSGLTSATTETGTLFKFYRGTSLISSTDVNIYGVGTHATVDLNTGDLAACTTTAAGIDDDTYTIIVSFDNEETITAGSSQTYYLKASISGGSSDDSITTKLAIGDEAVPLTLFTTSTNANTAKIYSATGATALFTGAAELLSTIVTTGGATGESVAIIWSDKSADAHAYPTVNTGTVTVDTGSYDYTNGYLLKLTGLSSATLTY
jgi:hypothetical protein